jgi:hypothetical protein
LIDGGGCCLGFVQLELGRFDLRCGRREENEGEMSIGLEGREQGRERGFGGRCICASGGGGGAGGWVKQRRRA